MNYIRLILTMSLLMFGSVAIAQNSPFGNGWSLEPNSSSLRFQSVKKQSTIESSTFATITGDIDADGLGTVKILLDSVDTKVDLRNVRMRFLFFETFQYPEAVVTLDASTVDLDALAANRRMTLKLPFSISLHGVSKTLEANLTLTLISDDLIAVSTSEPITLAVADFNLAEGLGKLMDAASVEILPSTTVTFDFIFKKRASGDAPALVAQTEPTTGTSVALEAKGDFSLEACIGRFEILSRTGNIYFAPGSARLADKSAPLLNTLADVVTRCPDLTIQVNGHTDSKGGSAPNQTLSERRAASVANYLKNKGISSQRVRAVGFGEDQPIATNDTPQGRSKNRRIEFSVAN